MNQNQRWAVKHKTDHAVIDRKNIANPLKLAKNNYCKGEK